MTTSEAATVRAAKRALDRGLGLSRSNATRTREKTGGRSFTSASAAAAGKASGASRRAMGDDLLEELLPLAVDGLRKALQSTSMTAVTRAAAIVLDRVLGSAPSNDRDAAWRVAPDFNETFDAAIDELVAERAAALVAAQAPPGPVPAKPLVHDDAPLIAAAPDDAQQPGVVSVPSAAIKLRRS